MILPPTYPRKNSEHYKNEGLSPVTVRKALGIATTHISLGDYTSEQKECIFAIDIGAQRLLDQITDCQRITAKDLATRVR